MARSEDGVGPSESGWQVLAEIPADRQVFGRAGVEEDIQAFVRQRKPNELLENEAAKTRLKTPRTVWWLPQFCDVGSPNSGRNG
jgi:hypothetical protein